MKRNEVVDEFKEWCDSKDDDCPVVCLNALALLGDGVKPRHDETGTAHYCGDCGTRIFFQQKFCSECGRMVKWD